MIWFECKKRSVGLRTILEPKLISSDNLTVLKAPVVHFSPRKGLVLPAVRKNIYTCIYVKLRCMYTLCSRTYRYSLT